MAVYQLSPKRKNLHGVLDARLKPALHIRSGDTVFVTTLEPDWRTSRPEPVTHQAPVFPRIPGLDDGHALCGPIYIENLTPGMSLRVDIGTIKTANWGWSSVGIGTSDHLARLGFSGKESFRIWDILNDICIDPEGLKIPATPFPGVLAVAPKGHRSVRTHIPGNHGGNLDCRLLRPGSSLYLPVFHKGGLFSVGDGHAAQGDGESGGTAIECGFQHIELTFRSAPSLIESPVAHTPEGYLTFGFDADLTTAAYLALKHMRQLLHLLFGLEEKTAMTLCSVAADVRVTQIVNGIRGCHVLLPHNTWNMLAKHSGKTHSL